MAKFDRKAFLSAATTLLEDVVPSGLLGLGDVPIRELTAAQRLEAVEVAKVYDADGEEITLPDGTTKLDTAKYWAALIQMSVLDPATCYDGDTFVEGRGSLLLEPDDILELAERGREVLRVLAQHIMNTSWLTRADLFRGNHEAHDRQPAENQDDGPRDQGDEPQGVGAGDDGTRVGDA